MVYEALCHNYETRVPWIRGSSVLGRCHYGHFMKMYRILEILLFHSDIHSRKTKCVVMMSVNPSTKFVKQMTPDSRPRARPI